MGERHRPLPHWSSSPAARRMLIGAGNQTASWHDLRVVLLIEAHHGGVCSVQVSEHADAAAEADTLAHPELGLTAILQWFVHLVCLPPYLSRGIRRADPFGRFYGIGTVTVTSGVVTVAVVTVGVVTVTGVIGVSTVTVAATVADNAGIGNVGRETVGTGSVEGNDGDVAAAPVERCVDAGAALSLEPSIVLP